MEIFTNHNATKCTKTTNGATSIIKVGAENVVLEKLRYIRPYVLTSVPVSRRSPKITRDTEFWHTWRQKLNSPGVPEKLLGPSWRIKPKHTSIEQTANYNQTIQDSYDSYVQFGCFMVCVRTFSLHLKAFVFLYCLWAVANLCAIIQLWSSLLLPYKINYLIWF